MCRRVDCPDCKKPTYAGCGAHIEQVLGDVPPEKRCTCRESKGKEGGAGASAPGILKRMFGI